MKKTLALGAAVALTIVAVPAASATPAPSYPRCITTTWAAKHYHQPKTPRGTTCGVRGKNIPAPGSTSIPGVTITVFETEWFPQSWTYIGMTTNAAGDVTGVLVRRPR